MTYMNTLTGEIIDEERFNELDERYNAHEIFSMCERERQEIYEEFYDAMREKAIDNMDYEPAEKAE